MRPIDAPAPKPAGNAINQNHDNLRPTLGKKSPQIGMNKGLETSPIDAILSRTSNHSFTNTTTTQYRTSKIDPRGELSICEILPILGADWFVWLDF